MIDLALTDEQESFARSAAAVVERHGAVRALEAPIELWQALAELGVLGLCAPTMGGDALDLVVAMEALGSRTCPGPLVAAAAASLVLDGDELDAIVTGRRRATLVGGGLVPWPIDATVWIELTRSGAWLVESDDVALVATLSGESWGRADVRRVRRLGESERAIVLAELANAAYLVGAGLDVVAQAAEHARSRVQFERPIGDFQAVAHPLARSHAELRATLELVRLSARRAVTAREARSIRAVAARASCTAGDRAHQVFGAVGFATETGVATTTARIRQWAVLPIGED
ncbi:MAG: acyl-CoA dehydrogenase [Actinomycetota bacterium]